MNFGTGVVYHCTFGDRDDFKRVAKYKLPVITSINEDGTMNENAGFLKGLKIVKAREKIVEELKKEKLYLKEEDTPQSVTACERCKTPLEIIPKTQWFFATSKMLEKLRKASADIEWFPDFAKQTLDNWIDSSLWDWVISRQRYWATPFPVWYCEKCNNTVYAKKDELPVDPTLKIKNCPKCKSKMTPDTDVMDTWMDSSVTPLWISRNYLDSKGETMTSLRSQGDEIIKTWLYYSVARCLPYGKMPFKSALINGMVMGVDGKKMSKRKPETHVFPEELIEKYSADAFRQWCGRSVPGEYWPIKHSELDYSQKFLTKLWNISRFCEPYLKSGNPNTTNFADRWIMNKFYETIILTEGFMDKCLWGNALESVRNFVWHDLADYYLEMVKHRLYSEDHDDNIGKVLNTILSGVLIMMSPFTPFITEELWSSLYSKESIHLQSWPKAAKPDEAVLSDGENAKLLISAIRAWKTSNQLSLGKPIEKVTLYASKKNVEHFLDDLKGTLRIENLSVEEKTMGTRINEKFGFSVDKA